MPRNRSLPPHLEIRRSGHFWRRRLPRALALQGDRTPSKKSFLCLSLRTHVPSDAKILARRLTAMSDLVFAASAETVMAIAPEVQVRMLEGLGRFEIAAFERARAVAGPRSLEAATMDLRREEALQATLRQALWLGDREVARHPLRHVAAQLGIALDETDEDWAALDYEATKVLLDVSQERARRQQGVYDQPSVHFRRAVANAGPSLAGQAATSMRADVAPATFASASVNTAPALPPAGFATAEPAMDPMRAESDASDRSDVNPTGQPRVASGNACVRGRHADPVATSQGGNGRARGPIYRLSHEGRTLPGLKGSLGLRLRGQ